MREKKVRGFQVYLLWNIRDAGEEAEKRLKEIKSNPIKHWFYRTFYPHKLKKLEKIVGDGKWAERILRENNYLD